MAVINSARLDLREVVDAVLHDYHMKVDEELFEALDEVSKETVSRLKKESKAAYPNSKEYHKGWTRTQEKGRLRVGYVIHGKTRATYAKAHLLEFGHAKRGGGRVPGRTHIQTVNDWAQNEAFDRVVSKIVGEAWK